MNSIPRRAVLGGGLALIANGVATRAGFSAPAAEPWQRWAAHDAGSKVVVDHQSWGSFLRRYLVEEPDGINRLRYADVSAADRAALRRYIETTSKVAVPTLNQAEQFAYWVNLYNAITVNVVLEHYPVTSIRKISLGGSLIPHFVTGGSGPWQAKLAEIDGEAIGLDDIEHRILRPLFKDNRVHYAVNCASIGCPTLIPVPFTAATLQTLLDRGARLYVNHPRGARVERAGLTVSSIYRWYREDFGGNWQGVLAHLRRYANPATAQMLAPFETVAADDYDWQLIDAATFTKTAQTPARG